LACWSTSIIGTPPSRARKRPRARSPAPVAVEDAGQAPASEAGSSAAAGPTHLQLRNPLANFDKAQLKDWVERPLFAPTRKRPPVVAAAAPRAKRHIKPKLPPPSYDLLGIVRDGAHSIALLRKKGEGTSFRVEVGDMIGGWRVARMEPASVVLEREDGTSQTVPLLRE
jgi:hypothetical protein